MNNKFQQNFNTFTNIFILFILFFGGFVWADTNGVWQYASDTRGGIFGADEQFYTTNFTFINPVYFDRALKDLTNPNSYFINIGANTQLNNLSSNEFTTNKATINGALSVTNNLGNSITSSSSLGDGITTSTSATGKSAISGYTTNPNSYSGFFDGKFVVNSGNFSLGSVKNCNGKLVTDSSGNVYCGVDIFLNFSSISCPSGKVLESFDLNTGIKTCVSIGSNISINLDLINGLHSSSQCTSNLGTVVNDVLGNKFCKFAKSTCSGSFTKYKSWSSTIVTRIVGPQGASCNTLNHNWGNIGIETCWNSQGRRGVASGSATITNIGCY